MDSEQKPPHQETIPELVARLVIAFEKKQAAKKESKQSKYLLKSDADT
ncbi:MULTISPECIES: hypothetical protein [Tolypothrichaceae]|jgi:hypothetical protein|uniref:Uncharacterized protein n=1 Tax=Hassallia byssoidea VB512170 TaxID=1304833 RepID=A0A846H711_9CYAN|nr:hypothetical protein [Hassalia byssoidea]MBW4566464.1 hypothetical protein [Tolypothrix carrinoi HA7290-LM1]NEU72758.1 hypothetical protein [Hassalia byssoidea VB512170]